MITRVLTRHEVEAEPFRVWNAYVDLLASEDFHDLIPEQRQAYLVFWYESEVQNGGHVQYFENRGTKYLVETIEALGHLGATSQQQVLGEAGELWITRIRRPVRSAEEYCKAALSGGFDASDSRFLACPRTLQECLETYLERHQSLFVIIA